jgi:predicted DNA-binding transcriptional regulator AlpA
MNNPFDIFDERLINIERMLLDLKNPATPRPDSEEEIMDISKISKLTGYKESYLHKMVHLREIPFHKPNNGRLVFLRSEILEWIKAGRRATRKEIAEAVNGK